jgi:hypothetical protein
MRDAPNRKKTRVIAAQDHPDWLLNFVEGLKNNYL